MKKLLKIIVVLLFFIIVMMIDPFSLFSSDDNNSQNNTPVEEYLGVEMNDLLKTYNKIDNIKIDISKKDYQALIKYLTQNKYQFKYAQYYGLEETLNLYSKTNIKKNTTNNLLNDKGLIDVNKLVDTIQMNNKNYMSEDTNTITTFYKELNTTDIYKICTIICETINDQFINIDINKTANTLMNLKMFEKTGSASNAYITNDLTFVYNPTMTSMYGDMQQITNTSQSKEETIKSVIVHETMHLLQYSTSDNNNDNGIETGFSRMYNVPNLNKLVTVDSLWYQWLLEASAELQMSNYLKVNTGTYAKKISYVRSFNLSRFNDLNLKSNSLENLAFLSNIEDVYKKLNLKTTKEKNEFLNYMYSIEITQSNPEDFWNNYCNLTKTTPTNEEKDQIRMKIREDAIMYLSHYFYQNLFNSLYNNKVNDLHSLFYLMKLWEIDAYNHLEYTKINSIEYAKEFITYQQGIHDLLFEKIASSTSYTKDEIKQFYKDYTLQYKDNDTITLQCNLNKYSSYTQNFLKTLKSYNTKKYCNQQTIYEYITK